VVPLPGHLAVSVWLPAGSVAVGVYVAEQVETSPDPVTSVHVGVLPEPVGSAENVTVPVGLVVPDVAVTVAVHEVPVPA